MLLPPFAAGFVSKFRRDAVVAGYAQRDGALTGVSDGKQGTLSCWIKMDWTDAGDILTGWRTTPGFAIRAQFGVEAGDYFYMTCHNTAGAIILYLKNATPIAHGATWIHFLTSWDLAVPGSGAVYVTDVADTDEITFTNDTIPYSTVVSEWDLSYGHGGAVAELWFDPSYLDLSVTNNRRKFIDSSGKPAFLGVDGSLPTGTAPAVYCSVVHSEAASTYATNKGSGGNFATSVSFTLAGTSPTDP